MKGRYMWMLLALLPLAASANGTSGTNTINNIGIDTATGLINISGNSTWNNPDACGTSTFLIVQFSNPYYREVLAGAMLASAAGKNVVFGLSGCISTPWGVAPLATTITVY
jgi:hypothetical protein